MARELISKEEFAHVREAVFPSAEGNSQKYMSGTPQKMGEAIMEWLNALPEDAFVEIGGVVLKVEWLRMVVESSVIPDEPEEETK